MYEEKDETFSTGVYKSKSEDYIMLFNSQTLTSEHRYLGANTPNGEWKVIQPIEKNLTYDASHFQDYFYIRPNLEAKNFKIVQTPFASTTKENGIDVIPHRTDVLVSGIELLMTI